MEKQLSIGFYSSSLSKGGLELNMLRYAGYLKNESLRVVIFCVKDSPINQIANQEGFEIVEIKDIKNPLTEMLYIYSHIDESAFSYAEHLNYLSHLNTHVMIVDPTSKINHMYNYPKGLFKSTTLV